MTKDIILFVNAIRPATFEALEHYAKQTGRKFTPVVIVDKTIKSSISARNAQQKTAKQCKVIQADFDSPTSVRRALKPYMDTIYAVTCQYENSILELKKLIPYFPNLHMPTAESLDGATEKKLMRQMLHKYDPSLVPVYAEALSGDEATISKLEKSMKYPLMVKPSGLEGSLLVSKANNSQELRDSLKYTFKEIQKGYDTWVKRQTPAIVVEEYMEGDMYSIDTYVSVEGHCLHTPPVKVVTGHNIGFDDFFGYMRLAPAGLTTDEIDSAQKTAEAACMALGLRSVTAHVELMKTIDGWKVIELGPRIGGYRHDIYFASYGINHIMNDILNRAGDLTEVISYKNHQTAVFNIYGRVEGILNSVSGLENVASSLSYVWHKQALQLGDELLFAKNNGDPVVELMLSHGERAQFDSDVALMEKSIDIRAKVS